MFDNNHIAIHEVRYANSQENSLIVLFSDQREEEPQVQEMEVEVRKGDAYYDALRKLKYTPKKIKDTTADWKRAQSREIAKLVDQRVKIILEKEYKKVQEKEIQLSNLINEQKNKIKVSNNLLQQEYKKINQKYDFIKQKEDNVKQKEKNIKEKVVKVQSEHKIVEDKKRVINEKNKKIKELFEKERNQLIKNKTNVQQEHKLVEKKRKELQERDSVVKSRLKLVAEQDKKFEKLYTTKIEEIIKDTFERNTDPDQIFKFKLALFEIKEIKESEKAFKRKLRQAQSIFECYSIVNDLYQTNDSR